MNQATRRQFLGWPLLSAAAFSGAPIRSAPATAGGCIRLPDGRRLAYAEYGNPAGSKVVVHHHGLPDSRREAEVFLTALCACPDVRLISFDRPGFGDSDPVACRSFCGWVPDLVAALDSLGVSRFAVTAISAGTPYALAAAIALPDRVTRVALASAAGEHKLGRWNGTAAPFHRLCHTAPRVAADLMAKLARRTEQTRQAVLEIARPLAPAERQLFADPVAVEFAATVLLNGLKQGPAAAVQEGALFARPWGLPLNRVVASVTFWHGVSDHISPPWKPELLARTIRCVSFNLSQGDGHFSLPHTRAAELLAAAC